MAESEPSWSVNPYSWALPLEKQLALFRAAVVVVGKPARASERECKQQVDKFLALAFGVGEEFRSFFLDGGALVAQVRLSILWNKYESWYTYEFSRGQALG